VGLRTSQTRVRPNTESDTGGYGCARVCSGRRCWLSGVAGCVLQYGVCAPQRTAMDMQWSAHDGEQERAKRRSWYGGHRVRTVGLGEMRDLAPTDIAEKLR